MQCVNYTRQHAEMEQLKLLEIMKSPKRHVLLFQNYKAQRKETCIFRWNVSCSRYNISQTKIKCSEFEYIRPQVSQICANQRFANQYIFKKLSKSQFNSSIYLHYNQNPVCVDITI